MTGESKEIKKNEEEPFMMSGCQVTHGNGFMVVTGVGVWSEWGSTLSALQEERDTTPLQAKLEDVATAIGKLGLTVAVLTFAALMIVWGVRISQTGFVMQSLIDIVGFFIIAVTIVVVAVPEGLPLAVTISLAYSMKKMMKENNLVRHLEACETMGGATNICSDKTGTLTQNIMTVVEAHMLGKHWLIPPTAAELTPDYVTIVTDVISCNSTVVIEPRKEAEVKIKKTQVAPQVCHMILYVMH